MHALTNRARLLGAAFRSVVFAQVRISALNTALTGFYLLVVVPWIGIQLPLTKTMIAVTFIAGLLPVIGNLISNTSNTYEMSKPQHGTVLLPSMAD